MGPLLLVVQGGPSNTFPKQHRLLPFHLAKETPSLGCKICRKKAGTELKSSSLLEKVLCRLLGGEKAPGVLLGTLTTNLARQDMPTPSPVA